MELQEAGGHWVMVLLTSLLAKTTATAPEINIGMQFC